MPQNPSAPATMQRTDAAQIYMRRPGSNANAPNGGPGQPAQTTFQNIAREQGNLNQQAAYDQFLLSNPNINSPYGSVNWQGAPGERGTVTTTLSPEQQQAYDQSSRLMNQGLMSTQLGQEFDMSGAPNAPNFNLNSLPNAPQLNPGGLPNMPGFDLAGLPQSPTFNNSNLPSSPNFSIDGLPQDPTFNMSALPNAASFDPSGLRSGPDLNNTLTRDKLAQALIDRDQPAMDRKRSGMETQLANQGIMRGSEAYQGAQDDLSRSENDFRLGAYARAGDEQAREYGLQADARDQAFNELERGYGMQSDSRRNAFGEQRSIYDMGAEARTRALDERATEYGLQSDARERGFNELERGFGMESAARGQALDERLKEYGIGADARTRSFDEMSEIFGLQSGQRDQALGEQTKQFELQSNARQQAIAEALTKRQLPLNELNALRTGAQINPPQPQTFGGYNYNPADIYGAYADQRGMNLSQRNANQASQDNMMNGLFSLGAAYMLSDRRTKENIKLVGITDSGFNLYDFNYIGDPTVRRSVMADEVENVMPWAVITGEDGFKRVDTYYV